MRRARFLKSNFFVALSVLLFAGLVFWVLYQFDSNDSDIKLFNEGVALLERWETEQNPELLVEAQNKFVEVSQTSPSSRVRRDALYNSARLLAEEVGTKTALELALKLFSQAADKDRRELHRSDNHPDVVDARKNFELTTRKFFDELQQVREGKNPNQPSNANVTQGHAQQMTDAAGRVGRSSGADRPFSDF